MVDVRIKPLEWVGVDADCYMHAGTILGDYRIWVEHDDEWNCDFEPNGGRSVTIAHWKDSADECKAAAQADYERRIRSTLSDAVAEREAEPVVWQHRRKYASVWGEVPQWEQCSGNEANDQFKRSPYHEYRPLYTSPPTSELEALRKRVAELEKALAELRAIDRIHAGAWLSSDVRRSEAEAQRDKLRKYAHEATKAITDLAGGGSENFDRELDGIYTADLAFCVERIRARFATAKERAARRVREGGKVDG